MSVVFAQAQKYKSYSGKFKEGTLSYTYFLDKNDEKKIDGNITYSAKNALINGFFKKDRRDSTWLITANNWGLANNNYSVNIACNYRNGFLTGNASYCLVLNDSSQILTAKSTFRSNLYVGDFSYDFKDSITLVNIKGQFTKNGFIDGDWRETFNNVLFETKYIKSVLAYYSEKDIKTGELKALKDNTQFVETYWKNVDSNGFSKINNTVYYGEKSEVTSEYWMKLWSEPTVLGEPNWLRLLNTKEKLNQPSFKEIKIIPCGENTPCRNKWLAANDTSRSDRIFTFLKDMPEFPGGEGELYKYLSKNIIYPITEKKKGIEGQVIITCVIDETGAITSEEVLREVENGPGLTQEALRVIKSMPLWKPGEFNGKRVKTQYNFPIRFSLDTSRN